MASAAMRARCWGGFHTGPLTRSARGGSADAVACDTAAIWRGTAAIVRSWTSRRAVTASAPLRYIVQPRGLSLHTRSSDGYFDSARGDTGSPMASAADRRRLVRALLGV